MKFTKLFSWNVRKVLFVKHFPVHCSDLISLPKYLVVKVLSQYMVYIIYSIILVRFVQCSACNNNH